MLASNFNATRNLPVTRVKGEAATPVDDVLVVEEPLEIRINGRRFTATMRTPGHDLELARGLLFAEGVISELDDIEAIVERTVCRERTDELVQIVDVTLHDDSDVPDHLWERSIISNSSCGLCGKASIEALHAWIRPLPDHPPIGREMLLQLPPLMRERQAVFQQTGGLHAAGIFSAAGECLALFEDIGRHNATDKAIGCGLEEGWLSDAANQPLVLLVSGRASFEILQKALVARIPVVCAVSAASTLAVDLAKANNQTLIGFLRDNRFTVYSGVAPI